MVTSSIQVHTLFDWCNDIDAMRVFYTDILGLNETNYRNDEQIGWLTYQVDSVQLVFRRTTETIPVLEDWSKSFAYSGGTLEAPVWLFRVSQSDFLELSERLNNSDVPVYAGDDIDTTRQLFVRDPMGRTIEIDLDIEE